MEVIALGGWVSLLVCAICIVGWIADRIRRRQATPLKGTVRVGRKSPAKEMEWVMASKPVCPPHPLGRVPAGVTNAKAPAPGRPTVHPGS